MLKNLILPLLFVTCFSDTAFADGDVKNGKKVFKKCKACHSVKEGKNKVGPTLYGIMGSPSGRVEGFTKYSEALLAANLVWDEATFTAFMKKPKQVVPKIKMAFGGIKNDQQIIDLIAYLNSNSSK